MHADDAIATPRTVPATGPCGPDGRAEDAAGESLALLMKRVVLSVEQNAGKRSGACGLTPAQWAPLTALRNGGSGTVVHLARACRIDAGAMTRLLDRLEKKSLCKRSRSTVDRRVVRIEPTLDGDAAEARFREVSTAVLNAHLAGFTDAEWRALVGYLQRMAKTGDALRGRSPAATERADKRPAATPGSTGFVPTLAPRTSSLSRLDKL